MADVEVDLVDSRQRLGMSKPIASTNLMGDLRSFSGGLGGLREEYKNCGENEEQGDCDTLHGSHIES